MHASLGMEDSIMTNATFLVNNLERVIFRRVDARIVSERASQRAFFAVSALIFAASTAGMIVWCTSMSEMGGMPLPGGWAKSMVWVRMPGQTRIEATTTFLSMAGVIIAAR